MADDGAADRLTGDPGLLENFALDTVLRSFAEMHRATEHVVIIGQIILHEKHLSVAHDDRACAVAEIVIVCDDEAIL